ncbi:hypothetical protein JTE90_002250 [Oedothorax gibbosus]|uniref:Uncharacterized protein n=1 Tax=Oedothorax gibbosus TaxID=931172 RepID=A0AAV6V5F1_9ARAC|nr:hypothetical protein JTE90_002250 [Oedothorax gibbosus]
MSDRFDPAVRINMLMITVTLCCVTAAYLVEASPASYRPYYHERTTYITDYNDDNNGGRSRSSYNDRKQRQGSQSQHGSSDFSEGESHSTRDRIKKDKFDQGSKSSVSKSGAKKEQAKKSHDKGFYEKEKRYGYEKSYGYERETKSHDKASQSHSHSDGYDHKQETAQHNAGEKFIRDLAEDGKKYKHGSKSQGSKSDFFDSSSNRRNFGKEFEAELTDDMKFFKRSGPISNFAPNFIPKEYMFGIEESLRKLKNNRMRGFHGLGGFRLDALNFGYNPLRYRYSSPDMKAEMLELNPLYLDVV